MQCRESFFSQNATRQYFSRFFFGSKNIFLRISRTPEEIAASQHPIVQRVETRTRPRIPFSFLEVLYESCLEKTSVLRCCWCSVVGHNQRLGHCRCRRKMRGDFSGNGLTLSTTARVPMMARAPVSQTPATVERRALSVEPAAPAAVNHCANNAAATDKAATAKAPLTAKKDSTATRSYSVEPAPAIRYSAPSRSSSTPLYLLPKSDAHRYGA